MHYGVMAGSPAYRRTRSPFTQSKGDINRSWRGSAGERRARGAFVGA